MPLVAAQVAALPPVQCAATAPVLKRVDLQTTACTCEPLLVCSQACKALLPLLHSKCQRRGRGRGRDRAGQGRANHKGKVGQDMSGQGRAGQGRAGRVMSGQDRAWQGRKRARQGQAGQGRQDVAGQGRAGQSITGQGKQLVQILAGLSGLHCR